MAAAGRPVWVLIPAKSLRQVGVLARAPSLVEPSQQQQQEQSEEATSTVPSEQTPGAVPEWKDDSSLAHCAVERRRKQRISSSIQQLSAILHITESDIKLKRKDILQLTLDRIVELKEDNAKLETKITHCASSTSQEEAVAKQQLNNKLEKLLMEHAKLKLQVLGHESNAKIIEESSEPDSEDSGRPDSEDSGQPVCEDSGQSDREDLGQPCTKVLEGSSQSCAEVLQDLGQIDTAGQLDNHVIEDHSGRPDEALSCDWESNLESSEQEDEGILHDCNGKEEENAEVMQVEVPVSLASFSPSPSTQQERLSAPAHQEPDLTIPLPSCQKYPLLPSSSPLQEPHTSAPSLLLLPPASAPLLQETHCTLLTSPQPALAPSSIPPHTISFSLQHPFISASSIPHKESPSLSCQQPPVLAPSSAPPQEPRPIISSHLMPYSQSQVHQPWPISSLLSEPDEHHVPISLTCTSANTRIPLPAAIPNAIETRPAVEGRTAAVVSQQADVESRRGSVQQPLIGPRPSMEDYQGISNTTPQASTAQAVTGRVEASACTLSHSHTSPVSAETGFSLYSHTSSMPQTQVHIGDTMPQSSAGLRRIYTGLPQLALPQGSSNGSSNSSSGLGRHDIAHNDHQYSHRQPHQASHNSVIVQPWIDQGHRQQSGHAHYCQQQQHQHGNGRRNLSNREVEDQERQVGVCSRPWTSGSVSHSSQHKNNYSLHCNAATPFLLPSDVQQQRLLDNPHCHLPHQHHHAHPHYLQQSYQLQGFDPWHHYPSLAVQKTSSFHESGPRVASATTTNWHCRHPHCRNEHRQHHPPTPYMQHDIMPCDSMTTSPYPSVWRPYSEANRSTGFCVSDSLTRCAPSRQHPLHIDHTSPGLPQHTLQLRANPHAFQIEPTPHILQIEPTPHPLQIEPNQPTSRIESFFVDRLLDDM